ncbi:DeoR family transcriptional regulator [Nonomuraea salmonea]|uniref:DeoR family transcriptional regulator n=1 Tax=Nonomuraea salmonea TaxID=46181 RepID=UPI0031ECE694
MATDASPAEDQAAAADAAGRLPDERRNRLVDLLRRRGIMRVHDLATELAVSAITIRRDITLLAEEGVIRRVRGGATLTEPPEPASAREPAEPPARRRRRSRWAWSSPRSTTTTPT